MKKKQIVINHLISLINDGKVKNGEKFPSEAQLITKFKFSKQPIREAFKHLQQLNIAFSKQGEGYFLGNKIKSNVLFCFGELFDNTRSRYYYAGIVNSKDIWCETKEVFLEHDQYRKIVVRRFRNNEPFIYEESYLPLENTPKFDIELINEIGIFKYLENIEGFKISYSQKNILQAPINFKDTLTFEYGYYDGSFVLDIGNVFDQNGVLMEYCLNFYEFKNFKWNFIEHRKNI
ncbi:GntR family transcriptional regulator [Spiroplasma tabanidicola]|uniref:HTH gntR-type domain-containing protein n=1 Tax=Spiroplasma tabanidicola TaxID=324079 RepID=A0A6I6CBW2_9MOLU|nr:GntR family transcriptional regulator [Spiroplasma tabanidicola]QGS51582.1 hypothetical protein STABA_v1c02150 [Spiroplasma tabanidicola]